MTPSQFCGVDLLSCLSTASRVYAEASIGKIWPNREAQMAFPGAWHFAAPLNASIRKPLDIGVSCVPEVGVCVCVYVGVCVCVCVCVVCAVCV